MVKLLPAWYKPRLSPQRRRKQLSSHLTNFLSPSYHQGSTTAKILGISMPSQMVSASVGYCQIVSHAPVSNNTYPPQHQSWRSTLYPRGHHHPTCLIWVILLSKQEHSLKSPGSTTKLFNPLHSTPPACCLQTSICAKPYVASFSDCALSAVVIPCYTLLIFSLVVQFCALKDTHMLCQDGNLTPTSTFTVT